MKSQVLPIGSYKFRENGADSVTFHTADHTVALPSTVTISRVLPTPRKGNPGTLKIFINSRQNVMVDVGLSTERSVLMIVKTETSFPVEVPSATVDAFLLNSVGPLIREDAMFPDQSTWAGRTQSVKDLFSLGILPDEQGDPSA